MGEMEEIVKNRIEVLIKETQNYKERLTLLEEIKELLKKHPELLKEMTNRIMEEILEKANSFAECEMCVNKSFNVLVSIQKASTFAKTFEEKMFVVKKIKSLLVARTHKGELSDKENIVIDKLYEEALESAFEMANTMNLLLILLKEGRLQNKVEDKIWEKYIKPLKDINELIVFQKEYQQEILNNLVKRKIEEIIAKENTLKGLKELKKKCDFFLQCELNTYFFRKAIDCAETFDQCFECLFDNSRLYDEDIEACIRKMKNQTDCTFEKWKKVWGRLKGYKNQGNSVKYYHFTAILEGMLAGEKTIEMLLFVKNNMEEDNTLYQETLELLKVEVNKTEKVADLKVFL